MTRHLCVEECRYFNCVCAIARTVAAITSWGLFQRFESRLGACCGGAVGVLGNQFTQAMRQARAGLKTVLARPGTFIPGKDFTIGLGNIRGVESQGMMCSAGELGLPDAIDGIIELPADAPVGAAYAEWAKLGDPVIEINLTPNRQDCTGVHGIARDLSAADMGKFKDPGIKQIKGEFPCPVKVTVEDATLCPGFALRLVRGAGRGDGGAQGRRFAGVDRDQHGADRRPRGRGATGGVQFPGGHRAADRRAKSESERAAAHEGDGDSARDGSLLDGGPEVPVCQRRIRAVVRAVA
eukprot:gene3563-4865_t